RQCNPGGLTWAGRPLVGGDGSREQGCDLLARQRGGGVDVKARDRIAFLRYGARGAAALMEWCVNLGRLGLHEQLDVHGNLSERPGEKAEKASDFADAVAQSVPSDIRLAEPEFLHQFRLHLEAIAAERGQRPDG